MSVICLEVCASAAAAGHDVFESSVRDTVTVGCSLSG
jgi:hypothetical protein